MEEIQVIKNDNSKELLNIDKIHKHLEYVCKGLEVSQIDIIKKARLKFFNNIKSADIQDSLIQAAQELITTETPDYTIAAGRLLNQKVRKEVYNQYTPKPFKECIKERIKDGFYSKDLLNYTDEELDFLGSKIDYSLDENLEYSSFYQLYSKYLLKSNNKVIETPQEIFMLIPMAIFYNKKYLSLIIEGYKLLSQRKIALPTPIMNGARTPFKQYISCNLIDAGDSVESLSKANAMVMSCTANKSGIGINISKIRGLGARIGNPERVKHTGILPLIKAFESSTASLSQVSRGGSSTIFSTFYHYEIELFSQLSDSKGTTETRARHTDQAIIINKWFLQKALNKEDIYLFHINEVPKLYDLLGYPEEFDKEYQKYAKSVSAKHKKKINAYDLLELFIYERIVTGRLYFVFADNCKNSSFKENIYHSNLCMEITVPSRPLDYSLGTPEIGVCILGNVNLGYSSLEDLPKCANFLVRFLDEMIDVADYNSEFIEYAAKNRRTLGIGYSNLFGFLAKNKVFYNTQEARDLVSKYAETFTYYLYKTSIELAKENTEFGFDGEITRKGSCELFQETIFSDELFTFERFKSNLKFPKLEMDWESLRNEMIKYGIRNSTLSAIPPSGNAAEVSNSTNGVEPPRELVTIKTNKNTQYKKLVPFYKRFKNYYTTAWSPEFNNQDYFKLIACFQRFLDQSVSLNQYTNTTNNKENLIKIETLLKELILCFNFGLKTIYYQNFRTNEDIDGLQESQEGCSSGGCSV